MTFCIDPKLCLSSSEIIDWPLCKVLFKHETAYAWFILVPRKPALIELSDLAKADQERLLKEIHQTSSIIHTEFAPDKINIATLGNQVPQLHIHVVGRYKTDPLWPESIWQKKYQVQTYDEAVLAEKIAVLKQSFSQAIFAL